MRYRGGVKPPPDRGSQSTAKAGEEVVAGATDALVRAVRRFENIRVLTSRAVRDIGADVERLRQGPQEGDGAIIVRILESLTRRAQRLDDEAKGLADALGRAAGELEVPSRSSKSRRDASAPPQAATPGSVPRKSSNARAPEPASEGVRLMALQMAVGGSNREEVEARLRGEFEVDVTDAVLDELFGSVSS